MPQAKVGFASFCTRTLWLGRIPESAKQSDLVQALSKYGEPVECDLVQPRACAYVVMPDRLTALKTLEDGADLRVQGKSIKMAWAPGKGIKDDPYRQYWDSDIGVAFIPYTALPTDLHAIAAGSQIDMESLPVHLKGAH